MAANPSPDPVAQFLCVLIDGDGHHAVESEGELHERIVDLVMSNPEVTFKRSFHGGDGFPRMLIVEVTF